MSSSYDDIAEMYDALWVNAYLPGALPALERLIFCHLRIGSRVLDLCCGCGHMTAELVLRGYRVLGVDNSQALIDLARKNVPHADFTVQDARRLQLPDTFDAAVSTFDSLNHILSLDDLLSVFCGVHRALREGGRFVFDMNLDEAYTVDMGQWTVNFRPSAVGLSRGLYDRRTHTAQTELIWFTQTAKDDCWRRRESVVEERCYEKSEIVAVLEAAGFKAIEAHHGVDLRVERELGYGRYFFAAVK